MEQPDPKHFNDFLQNSIQILDTLVLSIELPPEIVAAINRQTDQFYQIQEFKYRVEREVEESKRKQIEANGIAAFQRTVSQGISDSYLRWRGIEATLALAQSKNSKIVIIGSGKEGLPIILGNMDNNPAGPGPGPIPAPGSAPAGGKIPAPAENAPAGTSSMAPAGGAPTEAQKKTSATTLSTPVDTTTQPAGPPSSSIALDLSEIKSLLSRLSEGLRLSDPAKPSGPQTQSKQQP